MHKNAAAPIAISVHYCVAQKLARISLWRARLARHSNLCFASKRVVAPAIAAARIQLRACTQATRCLTLRSS